MYKIGSSQLIAAAGLQNKAVPEDYFAILQPELSSIYIISHSLAMLSYHYSPLHTRLQPQLATNTLHRPLLTVAVTVGPCH